MYLIYHKTSKNIKSFTKLFYENRILDNEINIVDVVFTVGYI